MGKIWANSLLPKALKGCPKSKISPNLVTLVPFLFLFQLQLVVLFLSATCLYLYSFFSLLCSSQFNFFFPYLFSLLLESMYNRSNFLCFSCTMYLPTFPHLNRHTISFFHVCTRISKGVYVWEEAWRCGHGEHTKVGSFGSSEGIEVYQWLWLKTNELAAKRKIIYFCQLIWLIKVRQKIYLDTRD